MSTAGANTALGQSLFITDCAQCHNFDGAGGALTYGKFAPPLTQATNTQMFEAMLTGPEAMPVFPNTTITPAQKRDITDYVTRLRAEPNPGGLTWAASARSPRESSASSAESVSSSSWRCGLR